MIQPKKLKHSKFRNTGILFELLVKQVTSDILSGNNNNTSAADILKKYFNESTELGRELKLYQLISEETTKDNIQAEKLLEVIIKNRSKIGNQNLDKQKFEVVKEIKSNWDVDSFMKGSIGNYKLLASIYKVLEESSRTDIQSDAGEIFQARNVIMEHLATSSSKNKSAVNEEKDNLIKMYKEQSEDVRLLTYKLLVDNFNKKYSCLGEDQKVLIKEYIYNVTNTTSLKEKINKCVDDITSQFSSIVKSIDDSAVKIKLKETTNQLTKIRESISVRDNHVTAILLSYELIKEFKK